MDNQNIYMTHVAYSSHSSTSYPGPSNKQQVFQGNLTYNGSGWFTIVLQTPFVYNGTDNLLIYTESHDGSYTSGYPQWRSTPATGTVIYDYSDGTFPTGTGNNLSDRPNIKIHISSAVCSSNRVPLVINVTGQQNNDVSVYKLFSPKKAVITPAEEVKIRVRNFGLQAQSNIPVSYSLNGGTPVTETISATLQPNDSVDFTFNQTVNLGIVGQTYNLKVYTHLATDINYLNDTITVSKQIKWLDIALAVPYFENFDSSGTYWANDTINNQWERGIPTANTLNTAHSAPNVWATKLATTYNAASGDGDKLYSPKFVVDGFDSVIVKFWNNVDMDASVDGGSIQYSTDGVNWPLLGYIGDPAATNWYNYSTGGNFYWNATSGWEEASYMIDLVNVTKELSNRKYCYCNSFT
jgi:hypothetical protein